MNHFIIAMILGIVTIVSLFLISKIVSPNMYLQFFFFVVSGLITLFCLPFAVLIGVFSTAGVSDNGFLEFIYVAGEIEGVPLLLLIASLFFLRQKLKTEEDKIQNELSIIEN